MLKAVDDPGLNKPEWDSNCADDAGVRGVRFASRALSSSDCAATLTQMGDFRGAGRPCFDQYVFFMRNFESSARVMYTKRFACLSCSAGAVNASFFAA